jgi:hypothetical protein
MLTIAIENNSPSAIDKQALVDLLFNNFNLTLKESNYTLHGTTHYGSKEVYIVEVKEKN